MAEKILRQISIEKRINLQVKSAGIATHDGSSASINAMKILEKKGIDSHHSSQIITPELLEWSAVILTMTKQHKNYLHKIYPDIKDKVFTLNEFVDTYEEDEEISQRLDSLYADLEIKQSLFMGKYQEKIRALEMEYNIIRQRVNEIQAEIKSYQDMLEQELVELKEEIQKIQQEQNALDIADPFGGTIEDYEVCAVQIESAIQKLLLKIKV
jgi:protein-tyrosine-phosphatase